MKEKLIIKNFGPIGFVDLDLSKFNVLIGEQATGKSTVAKLLAVCRYFSYIKADSILSDQNRGYFLAGLVAWGLNESIQTDSYIYYECKDYSLTVEHEKIDNFHSPLFLPTLKPLSKEFKSLLLELKKIMPKGKDPSSIDLMWKIPSSFYQNDVAGVMDNPLYLRTERGLQSIFSLGKSSIRNISDSLFNNLADIDQIARAFKTNTTIEPLGITYKNDDGRGYIRKKNQKKFLTIYNAASGYQSAIPIILSLKYYSEIRKKKKTFIIEEPELNLFPTAQYELVKFLAESSRFHNEILLTTHSPYIMTSLNNLMYAFKVGRGNKRVAVAGIIEEKYWVNPEEVSAYILKYDKKAKGTVQENITDKEGLLRVQKIDEVSSSLNSEFDKIMNIELNIS